MTPRKAVLALALLAGVVVISSALAAGGGEAPTGTTIKLLEDEAPGISVPIGHHTGLAAGDEASGPGGHGWRDRRQGQQIVTVSEREVAEAPQDHRQPIRKQIQRESGRSGKEYTSNVLFHQHFR